MPYKDPQQELQWRKDNRSRINETARNNYHKNKTIRLEKQRQKYANNPDWKRRKNRIYNQINREKLNLLDKLRFLSDPEKYKNLQREAQNRYRKNHPDRILNYYQQLYTKLGYNFNKSASQYFYAFQAWSKAVKQRDNNQCQICNTPSTESHHIFSKLKYPLLSLNLNNGIALCDEHHKEIHILNGWK